MRRHRIDQEADMASATTGVGRAASREDLALGGMSGLADEELLERFLTATGPAAEAAFEGLVRRHGPMVLGVCRQILTDHNDAEDAFQATFLVLARKARSIRDRRVLGRWLYEVAYRIAVRAKVRTARRRAHERQGAEMWAVAPGLDDRPARGELLAVIHDEINRLPNTYRSAVVLCYLEGHTNEQAAALLSWPVGTVKGRLSRARDLLRTRLSRRGVALSAALLAILLCEDMAPAGSLTPALVDSAVRTAVGDRAGEVAVIDKRVAELAEDPPAARPTLPSSGRLTSLALIALAAAILLTGGYVATAETSDPWAALRSAVTGSAGMGAGPACH
jgi:RNA polymerase sigma factor (sigma-70 family)